MMKIMKQIKEFKDKALQMGKYISSVIASLRS